MASRAETAGGSGRWRLWALAPLLLLVVAVGAFSVWGKPTTELLGRTPPPADEFDVRRVEFKPGEIRIRVTNPQQDDLTIASVTVDDAIWPFEVDGPATLSRLRSATVVVPYDWVEGEPISVGVTSQSGIETVEEVPAAVLTPGVTTGGVLGYALVGALVGVVPVALGLLWLPSLRRASPQWLAAFMALTAGLLTFLGIDALAEAVELSATLPGTLGGPGLVLLGVALSWLGLTALSHSFSRRGGGAVGGLALAVLVAIGIGLHNFGEGLAIGSSFALGELALGTFLVVGFMIHNVTEGLGIAAPIAEGKRPAGAATLAALVLVAGAPAVAGGWLGGFAATDLLGALFFAMAAGAAFEVVAEVGRYVRRRTCDGITSPSVLGGFLAGIGVMYVTGLLAA